MTIRRYDEASQITIDLDGQDGNAFVLMGVAQRLGKRLGYDTSMILEEMKSGNYRNLVRTFDKYFGEHVILETTDEELLKETPNV